MSITHNRVTQWCVTKLTRTVERPVYLHQWDETADLRPDPWIRQLNLEVLHAKEQALWAEHWHHGLSDWRPPKSIC